MLDLVNISQGSLFLEVFALFLWVWSTCVQLGGEPGPNISLCMYLRDPHLQSFLSGVSTTLWFIVTCFSQFLWPERWSASLLCFFTVPHNWCCLQNKGNRETRKKNKGISSHSLDHRGPFFQFLFPRTQSSLGVKVTSSQWWQCNAMTKAGPESGIEEKKCKKWEKRNLLYTFWKAGVPFPDPLDRKR